MGEVKSACQIYESHIVSKLLGLNVYNHTNFKLHRSGCNLCLNFGHVHVCMVFENRLGYVRMVPSI